MKESMPATYLTEDPEYINLKTTNESRKKKAMDLSWKFSRKELKMAKKYLKMCLSSLAIRKMKIEITLGFHFTQVGMAKMNKIADYKLTVN